MFLQLALGCLLLVGLLSSPTEAQETCFSRSWGGKAGWEVSNEAREEWFFAKDKLRGVQYEIHHYYYDEQKWKKDRPWFCFKVEASSCSKNYTDPDEISVFESSDLEAIRCLTQDKGCAEFVNKQEFVNGVLNWVQKKAQYLYKHSRNYIQVLMRRSPVSPNLLFEVAPANRERKKVVTRLVAGDSLVSLVMAATLSLVVRLNYCPRKRWCHTAEEVRDKCIEKYSKHQVLNVTDADTLKSHYEKCDCRGVPRNRINTTSFSGLYPIPAGNRGVVMWEAWKLCTAPQLAMQALKQLN
eukprot:g3694.t1